MGTKLLKNLLIVTVPTLIALVLGLEIVFRFVIPASQRPTAWWDDHYKILKYNTEGPRTGLNTWGVWATNRANWRINNHGWNSSIDYHGPPRERPLIAIIGDSYVDGVHVPPESNIAAIVRDRLKGRFDVYGFGMCGASLATYLNMARYVDWEFDPDIIVFNTVPNDFEESLCNRCIIPGGLCLKVSDDKVAESVKEPSLARMKIKQLYACSAFARYLRLNLKLGHGIERIFDVGWKYGAESSANKGSKYVSNIDLQGARSRQKKIETAAEYVVATARIEMPSKPLLFMIDPDRNAVYSKEPEKSQLRWMSEWLEAACKKHGAYFLDLSGPFLTAYLRTGRRYEFLDDWHWNEYGHETAALALVDYLSEKVIKDKGRIGFRER